MIISDDWEECCMLSKSTGFRIILMGDDDCNCCLSKTPLLAFESESGIVDMVEVGNKIENIKEEISSGEIWIMDN